jgi:hypothetical protein
MRPGDDEITTDVDPAWIASLRADTNGSTSVPAAHDAEPLGEAEDEGEVDDWTLAEPRWDPEATVGASDGLIERIRQEVRATPARPVTTSAPTSPDVPTGPASPTPAAARRDEPFAPKAPADPHPGPATPFTPPPSILEQPRPAVPLPGALDREIAPAVEAPAAAAAPSVEDLASTTVRWEPRQRLAATAPITDTALIAPPTHHGLDKTRVVIALIIAVALVTVVWLVVSSRGGDDPAPTVDSVPTSDRTDGSIAPSDSAPVDQDLPAEVGG